MQLMTWPMGRMGSRFGLLFEPARRRVMHSALGRFLDQPLDLAAGLVDSDGVERVLPFTQTGEVFHACEQFDRVNSITFSGIDQRHGLRFELNIHSPFYPQDETLCLMPCFYVELRVSRAPKVRLRQFSDPPKKVRLFLRFKRPETEFTVEKGRIDLSYDVTLDPRYKGSCGNDGRVSSTDNTPYLENPMIAHVVERLVSLNPGTKVTKGSDGSTGLTIELPVTDSGSGVKWRLVWVAHTSDPVLQFPKEKAVFRYNRHWADLDAVVKHAVATRDDNLLLSRRFEKLIEQTPLNHGRRHLLDMAFQSYLTNTFWCDAESGREWFSVLEGTSMYHSPVDVDYNFSMFYFVLWPRLLTLTFDAWAEHVVDHAPSGGAIQNHDMGAGMNVTGEAFDHSMPVEENCNHLLLLQAYAHWTGDLEPIRRHVEMIRKLALYLLWTDRDQSGFPSEGSVNTLDDGSGAVQYARKQTYLAIKRSAGLAAAADLIPRIGGNDDVVEKCRLESASAIPKIDQAAWLGDHYAVTVDRDSHGLFDAWTGEDRPTEAMRGWDDYSIYTTNALLLPMMVAQPLAFDRDRLQMDLLRSSHETLQPYGCGHTSSDSTNIWLSSNMWRDFAARYLNVAVPDYSQRYWDMLVFSNTGDQSFGYIDTYIGNELAFNPRGATAFGWLIAGPRLCIDRLDGEYTAIDPDRHRPQRWPLLPLADWSAGKVPVCVIDPGGNVRIECEIEPVKILGEKPGDLHDTIG